MQPAQRTPSRITAPITAFITALVLAAALPAAAKDVAAPPPPPPVVAQQSVLLSFDDFITPAIGANLPAGYGGFIWGDRWFALQGAVAGQNHLAVGSGLSIVIRRADGTPFYLDGADFWSRRGLDAVGDFYFVLYYQGRTVYNGLTARKGKQVFTGTPTLRKPDYTGPIDAFALAFDSNGLDWNHLAMDNLRFRVDLK